jgi:hypothetical protein
MERQLSVSRPRLEPEMGDDSATDDVASPQRRQRLTEPQITAFSPWLRAETLEGCFLYWMPLSNFPPSLAERAWLLDFMTRFSQRLRQEHNLRAELFFQFKIASSELSETFRAYALKCKTLLGLGRKPGAVLPTVPDAQQLKEAMSDGKPFDLNQWVGDFCYWFRSKRPEEQRQLFLGYGGLTTIFLAPDPMTVPPRLPFTPAFREAMPVFKIFDVDALVEGAFSLQDAFLRKSKQLFGSGLEDTPEYPSIMYIVPLLASGHFFAVSPEDRGKWFELFDVYINESPVDKGMILAFQKDYESLLLDVLDEMRSKSIDYPTLRGQAK